MSIEGGGEYCRSCRCHGGFKRGIEATKKKQKHVEVIRRCQNVWVFVHPVAENVQDGEHFAVERVKLL